MADAKPQLVESFYDLLAVSQVAGEEEIRQALKDLRRTHEQAAMREQSAAANEMLTRLNEAEEALLKPAKRAEYDRRASTVWGGFADVAFSPLIDRAERLAAVAEWMHEDSDAALADTQPGVGAQRAFKRHERLDGK